MSTASGVGLRSSGPVLVHLVRNGAIESEHCGHAVIVDLTGMPIVEYGDVDVPILPRSCNKPLQAIGMLRCGLAVEGPLLALAGASHAGEAFHIDGVGDLLRRHNLDESALQNPADYPSDSVAHDEWIRADRTPSVLAHNCSGKHAAMVATCRVNGWPIDSYLDPGHPLQQALSRHVGELANEPSTAAAVDGCGAPVFQVSLSGMARAFGRIAAATGGFECQLADAFREYSAWASGTRRDECALHRAVPGLVTKAGAEGTFAVGLASGHGLAIKVSDGSQRARLPIVLALLGAIGVVAAELETLTPVITGGFETVGEVRYVGPMPATLPQAKWPVRS